MKKLAILLLCVSTINYSLAQQIPPVASGQPSKEAYLQKSKKLWRAAIIMVSAGGAMAITGLALSETHYYDNLPAGLFIAGCAVMLSSLSFSIPAHICKKKAMSITFKNEPSFQLQKGMIAYIPVPAVSLKIRW